jgi:hypothetical protein
MKKTIEQRLLSARPESQHGHAEFVARTVNAVRTAQTNETFEQLDRKTGITKKERFMLKLKRTARILLIGGAALAISGATYAAADHYVLKWHYGSTSMCTIEPESCVKPTPAVIVGKDEKSSVPADWKIGQWGISAKSTGQYHLQYSVSSENKIYFTSAELSLAQPACDLTKNQSGSGRGGFFWITRYPADGTMDTSPLSVKDEVALLDSSGHKDLYKKIGNYYYYLMTPQTACTAIFGRPATDAENAAGPLWSKTIQALTDLLATFTPSS